MITAFVQISLMATWHLGTQAKIPSLTQQSNDNFYWAQMRQSFRMPGIYSLRYTSRAPMLRKLPFFNEMDNRVAMTNLHILLNNSKASALHN